MSRYAFDLHGRVHHVVLEEHAEGPRFLVEGETFRPEVKRAGPGVYQVSLDGETFRFDLRHGRIEANGQAVELSIRRARPALVRKGGAGKRLDGVIKPPMPGKIVEVHVAVGDEVAEGTSLLVLEAMKMQNEIRSPLKGTVTKVLTKEGQNVEAGTVLVEIEPAQADE